MITSHLLLKKMAPQLSNEPMWVVGGAVRDRILKRSSGDIDLILMKDPQSLANSLAKKFGGRAFRLDENFGVTRITFPEGQQLDFTKFQGKTLEDDIDRRDFSVNALAVPLASWYKPNWKKDLIDRHKGIQDLKKKSIRAISEKTFRDDPLRLIRAFRIAGELGFGLSPQTKAWVNKFYPLIKKSAPERIREELLKLFATPTSTSYILQMEKLGLLHKLLPEFISMKNIGEVYYGKGGVLTHTLESLKLLEDIFLNLKSWFPKCKNKVDQHLDEMMGGAPRRAHLKWAVLLHDIGKPATAKIMDKRLRFFEHEQVGADKIPSIGKRFRWSSKEIDLYGRMVRNHMRAGNLANHPEITDKALHRFFRDLGDDAIDMLLVSLGDHLSYLSPRELEARKSPHEKLTQRMVNLYYLQREKVLPPRLINGNEVMKAFKLKPSPLIGDLLRDATEAQSDGKIKTQEEALSYLKGRLPELQKQYPDE